MVSDREFKEGKMDSQFWLGVIVTVVVGVPGAYGIGILANMHTPRLVRFLESRKLLKKHKTRQQTLLVFNRIKAFRDGTRDRYPFYILLASAAVVCAIIASTLILITALHNEFPLAIPVYLLAAIAALTMLLLLFGIYETARQIERFDDYKTEIEQRWGPIDDEHPDDPGAP
jgi:CHASE2 domain-containing sensor protein